MHTFIRCPTCGTHIGARVEIYRWIRAKRMQKAHGGGGEGIQPQLISFSVGSTPVMKDVLDKLGLSHCCRGRAVSHIALSDKY